MSVKSQSHGWLALHRYICYLCCIFAVVMYNVYLEIILLLHSSLYHLSEAKDVDFLSNKEHIEFQF